MNTEYSNIIASYLMPSLNDFYKIPAKIYPIESIGTWKKNTNLKPTIIEKALEEINTDIVILDADCRINEYPKLFDEIPEQYDMAVFYLPWGEWYGHSEGKEELCSGTLFFRNRLICKQLVWAWKIEAQSINNHLNDQQVLQNLLNKEFPDIKIYKLPYEYCWINSMPNGNKPFVKKPNNVVIEHFQVSRDLRNKI